MSENNTIHNIECFIDNVTNAPQKPSDYKAWQSGFREAYSQILEIIKKHG